MSRIVVFGTDQRAAGEVTGMFNRGWMLAGNPHVTGGGSTTLTLTNADAEQAFFQFGRMVLVSHPRLPNWVGMIDPPWNAMTPVGVAVYNAEYLLSLRSPDVPMFLEGSVGEIVGQMIEMANGGDDLSLRLGDTARADQTKRQETLDGRTYWEQLNAILQRSGCEMQCRAEKDANGRLVIYLDIATQLGNDTGFLYSDGQGGNASFSNVVLDGQIVNRVTGVGDESGQLSRLHTTPFVDDASKQKYQMRSQQVQFRDVREQSMLDLYSKNYLAYTATPHLSFVMNIVDQGDAFMNARLGNLVRVAISNARLPGGVRGWRGSGRIVALAYTEDQNLLSAKVIV